jgi:hypothetical protein
MTVIQLYEDSIVALTYLLLGLEKDRRVEVCRSWRRSNVDFGLRTSVFKS